MVTGSKGTKRSSGKFSTAGISVLTLLLVAAFFCSFLVVLVVVYNKYRQIKLKIRDISSVFRHIIPKIRVGSRDPICYPKRFPPGKMVLKTAAIDNSPNGITGTKSRFDSELAGFLSKCIISSYNISNDFDLQLPSYLGLVCRLGENGLVLKKIGSEQKELTTTYIIAYRGTNSRNDILSDLDFSQVSFDAYTHSSGLMVHRGFKILWDEHKKDLDRFIRKLEPGDQIYLTGHSLGASSAYFSALYLTEKASQTRLTVYAFAPPRIGNEKFVRILGEKVPSSWAIKNRRDVVTTLPPPCFSMFGSIWIYDDYSQVYEIDIETGDIIDDHHLNTYVLAITANKEEEKKARIYWNRKGREIIYR